MSEIDIGTSLSVGDVGMLVIRSEGCAFRLLMALPRRGVPDNCVTNVSGGGIKVPSGWCGDGGRETGKGKFESDEEFESGWSSEPGVVVALQRDWGCGGGTRLAILLEPPVLQCERPTALGEPNERDEEE